MQGITNAVAISVGHALLADGAIRRWGGKSPIPEPVLGVTNATAIAASGGHTCAVLRGGTVGCWGNNGWGELGDGMGGRTRRDSLAQLDREAQRGSIPLDVYTNWRSGAAEYVGSRKNAEPMP